MLEDVLVYSHKAVLLSWMADTRVQRAASVFFRVGQYFDFIIVNAKNINPHK